MISNELDFPTQRATMSVSIKKSKINEDKVPLNFWSTLYMDRISIDKSLPTNEPTTHARKTSGTTRNPYSYSLLYNTV